MRVKVDGGGIVTTALGQKQKTHLVAVIEFEVFVS